MGIYKNKVNGKLYTLKKVYPNATKMTGYTYEATDYLGWPKKTYQLKNMPYSNSWLALKNFVKIGER